MHTIDRLFGDPSPAKSGSRCKLKHVQEAVAAAVSKVAGNKVLKSRWRNHV